MIDRTAPDPPGKAVAGGRPGQGHPQRRAMGAIQKLAGAGKRASRCTILQTENTRGSRSSPRTHQDSLLWPRTSGEVGWRRRLGVAHGKIRNSWNKALGLGFGDLYAKTRRGSDAIGFIVVGLCAWQGIVGLRNWFGEELSLLGSRRGRKKMERVLTRGAQGSAS